MFRKIDLNYFFKIMLTACVLVCLGLILWLFNIKKINEEQKQNISGILQNVIRLHAKSNRVVPEVVLLNTDTSGKTTLDSALITRITSALAEKYLTNDTVKFTDLDIYPLIDFSIKPNKQGNIVMTEAQLYTLKSHMEFLSKQFDIQVGNIKEEFGRDIERLNLWVTIWIGIIGFLGIFVPILINLEASRHAEQAKQQSQLALQNANEAQRKAQHAADAITDAQEHIQKVPEIERKIKAANDQLGNLTTLVKASEDSAKAAGEKAGEAQAKSSVLHLAHSITRLDLIDPRNLKHLDKELWKPNLVKLLKQIEKDLEDCTPHCERNGVGESLADLAIRLSRITLQKFVSQEDTHYLHDFINRVVEAITGGYTALKHEQLLAQFKLLMLVLSPNKPHLEEEPRTQATELEQDNEEQ